MHVLFGTREQAGQRLAEHLADYENRQGLVLGVARGGVPVGLPISRALRWPLDVIVPRKLPIPWSPEAGFGAIAPDGTMVLNEALVRRLPMGAELIRAVAREVQSEIARREQVYRGNRPFPDLDGRTVILTDDGLATGYTMIAAARFCRKRDPAELVVAVPVTPRSSAELVRSEVDRLVCLHVADTPGFAVASFYREFPDLTDDEVQACLSQAAQERVG